MKVNEYLAEVAYVRSPTDDEKIGGDDTPDSYYSKFDDSYITFVGLEDQVKFLADREVTEELTPGVGFSPKDNKWYGWSHRAIYGFEIGSECKQGDCHYVGSTLKEQQEDAIRFWQDDCHKYVICNGVVKEGDDSYFDIEWEYDDSVKNKSLHNTISGTKHYITPLGRGEWTAKTMEDAKQMAVDFNQGVS